MTQDSFLVVCLFICFNKRKGIEKNFSVLTNKLGNKYRNLIFPVTFNLSLHFPFFDGFVTLDLKLFCSGAAFVKLHINVIWERDLPFKKKITWLIKKQKQNTKQNKQKKTLQVLKVLIWTVFLYMDSQLQ